MVAARDELRRSSEGTAAAQEAQRLALEAQRRAFESQQSAFARLTRLEKVREKLRSKEYRLREQGVLELEAVEEKEKNSLEVELLAAQVAHLLPSTDSFVFDPSFLILPDIIFNDTFVPFL